MLEEKLAQKRARQMEKLQKKQSTETKVSLIEVKILFEFECGTEFG